MNKYNITNKLFTTISESNIKKIKLASFLFILLFGIIDYFTGYEFSFSIFYLIPIFIMGWFVDKKFGIMACITSGIIWQLANYLAGQRFSYLLFYVVLFLHLVFYQLIPQYRKIV